MEALYRVHWWFYAIKILLYSEALNQSIKDRISKNSFNKTAKI